MVCWLLLLLGTTAVGTTTVTVSNVEPRRDQLGEIVNAHDGCVVNFNGTFFLYGTVYEDCYQNSTQCQPPCGYNPNTFSLYTSPDMMTWTKRTDNILPAVTKDNKKVDYWMPNVGFNKRTSTFVMQYWASSCGFAHPCANIAISDSPYGPFRVVPPLELSGGVPSSTMGLFVDPDTNSAYVKYNVIGPNQRHVVERLSDDWLTATGEYAVVFTKPSFPWYEGGGMFSRRNAHGTTLYYYMTGSDCCFCSWGGDAKYWTSLSPLGPWHPGVAPQQQKSCDLTGSWQCIESATSSCRSATFNLTAADPRGPSNFTYIDSIGTITGGFTSPDGYIHFPDAPQWPMGVASSASGDAGGCDFIRWYGDELLHWCREGVHCTPLSAAQSAPEINYCANDAAPTATRVNPCNAGKSAIVDFTVPAQQFNVIDVPLQGGDRAILYFGERSMSAPDGLKSHNFQAWAPFTFRPDGAIGNLTFPANFSLDLPW